jgi:sulfide:quinone oxidoreductase
VALTSEGERIGYDRLIIAVGARPLPFLQGALTFAGPADVPSFRRLVGRTLRGARRGIGTRLTLVVPPAHGWALPAYELALVTRALLHRRGVSGRIEIAVVTSEDAPLAAFGPSSSDAVAKDLDAAGIELHVGSIVREWSWGRLHLLPEGSLPTDRVVSLPSLRGPEIEGVPQDVHGFIQAQPDGRVRRAGDVFVIGDAGPFPIKQGGIACQQADAVASTIARELGAAVEPIPFDPVLRGWLWDGGGGRFLRASLPGGRDESSGVSSRTRPLCQPAAKVAGRFIAPFLEERLAVPLSNRPPAPAPGL